MIKIHKLIKSAGTWVYLKFLILIGFRRLFNLKTKFVFSQTGEDMILYMLLRDIRDNDLFYIDVGCNDPIHDSNTFLFYLNGGSGICIDGNKSLIDKHKKIRTRDISICSLVSDEVEEVTFYISKENRVSTASKEVMINNSKRWEFGDKQNLKTRTLNEILDSNLPKGQAIHLLSIDVEGYDFKVLKSIDLEQYQPRVIVIEMHSFSLDPDFLKSDEVILYLQSYGYSLKYYATFNAYFVRTA
ncbi:MAG: FkbM family methyltransferase [Algoriphagus sp.]|uniref:FkbM family methyltransferase n=1 Tax=Algoriphagus sp. TaxID=1872435 RepID=UPI0026017AD2|nr:FkbM family methyltransferase [Algoriphagus sp.]MDG1277999.1 FkbM family methyltransferase [Algoriphagus sp.]